MPLPSREHFSLPTPQELSALPSSVLTSEITNVEAALANRYNANGTFAEMVDDINILGNAQKRVPWADLVRYRAALYQAQVIQAVEGPTGGIGILDANFRDGGSRAGGSWGY